MKKLFFLIPFCSICAYSPFLIQKFGDKSIQSKLAIQIPHSADWDFEGNPQKKQWVDQILQQKFFYLAQGYQSVALESEDRQFILKLFFKGESIHPWRRFIRTYLLHLREKIYGIDRVYQELSAAKIAYILAPDLTGVVFAHLNKTEALFPQIECTDSLGRKLQLALDNYRFVIQMKGISFEAAFALAIKANDLPQFERLTGSFVYLLRQRISRGIRNTDVAVEKNFGFLGETAIEWDFGQYETDQNGWTTEMKAVELQAFLSKAERFFQNNYPEWVPIFRAITLKSSIFEAI